MSRKGGWRGMGMWWEDRSTTGYVGSRAMVMKVQGRRQRGRCKRRWLDRVRDDIKEKGLSGEEVYDRATWRRMSSYIDPIQRLEYDEEGERRLPYWPEGEWGQRSSRSWWERESWWCWPRGQRVRLTGTSLRSPRQRYHWLTGANQCVSPSCSCWTADLWMTGTPAGQTSGDRLIYINIQEYASINTWKLHFIEYIARVLHNLIEVQ